MKGESYLFVVSGPSGVGKDSVMTCLRQAHPEIEKTISATTRPPRAGEAEGVNYYYRTEEAFRQLAAQGQILESNRYNGYLYGTLRAEVERRMAAGKLTLLNIDVHGAANIKRLYPGATIVFFRIMPEMLSGCGAAAPTARRPSAAGWTSPGKSGPRRRVRRLHSTCLTVTFVP